MSHGLLKPFNLPWHQHDFYWLSVMPKEGIFAEDVVQFLKKAGLQPLAGNSTMGNKVSREWKALWDVVYGALKKLDMLTSVDVYLTPGADLPASFTFSDRKSPADIQQLAESLWLGDALLSGRVVCYLQPVMANREKVFGYESFARVQGEDGSVIAGDRIVAASKILGVQNMIDRHLHVHAIKTFVSSDFNGFLFINFFPGFIQRPEVYLEALSETVSSYGVIAQHIVLDFTRMETPRDIAHIKSVCNYGRSKGYSLAFDDIVSLEIARKLVNEIRPDFVKIDTRRLQTMDEMAQRKAVSGIVELVHSAGGTVIAEGVEKEEEYVALELLGVDLFQGYFFSPPVPVETVLKQKKA